MITNKVVNLIIKITNMIYSRREDINLFINYESVFLDVCKVYNGEIIDSYGGVSLKIDNKTLCLPNVNEDCGNWENEEPCIKFNFYLITEDYVIDVKVGVLNTLQSKLTISSKMNHCGVKDLRYWTGKKWCVNYIINNPSYHLPPETMCFSLEDILTKENKDENS